MTIEEMNRKDRNRYLIGAINTIISFINEWKREEFRLQSRMVMSVSLKEQSEILIKTIDPNNFKAMKAETGNLAAAERSILDSQKQLEEVNIKILKGQEEIERYHKRFYDEYEFVTI